jgi:arabinose-5-phosphate isomerase
MKKSRGVLAEVRRVIALEAKTLLRLHDSVDASFQKATDLLAACRGKVVVTGIGKSGIIAQKIAATFASTGTPALYLHPADGLHGNIGLVQRHDLIIAVGKSGESEELNGILPTLRRLRVKMIVITAMRNSTLSRAAEVAVITPIEREACPLDLAPTCSTTAAMAVGDALAVALMKVKGFQRHHFALLHPGGLLGRRLTMRVGDVMRSGDHNPIVREDATTARMLAVMTAKTVGAVSIVNRKGRLSGLVTDYDVRRVLQSGGNPLAETIRSIMNPKPTTIRADDLAHEAVSLMAERPKPFVVLPVVDRARRPVGMIHLSDLRAKGL